MPHTDSHTLHEHKYTYMKYEQDDIIVYVSALNARN